MGLFSLLRPARKAKAIAAEMRGVPCENCGAPALPLDKVDFNKSCEEEKGVFLARSGRMVEYCLCDACGFCFAPEFRAWTLADFTEKIYNDDYIKVDPEYTFERPNKNARDLDGLFGAHKDRIRHLDFGGGSGLLSRMLVDKGWDSQSYDPMIDMGTDIATLGTFNLVTAFEVFEHVPDINALADRLAILCAGDGMILFSTFCNDGHVQRGKELAWWYAAPRNGHISLYSYDTLGQMFAKRGLSFYSHTPFVHIAFRSLPEWSGYKLG